MESKRVEQGLRVLSESYSSEALQDFVGEHWLILYSHGIDSLNCTLASLFEVAAMGFGATRTGAFTALVPCLPMFFSTWETYHTHTLYLGYFNGPTGRWLQSRV